MRELLQPGECVTIHYPDTTHVRFIDAARYLPRRILVKTIRDLIREPLSVSEFLRRPFTLRSRWLVRAVDTDLGELRQFYLGSAIEFSAPAILRAALYEPGIAKPIEFFGGEFGPSANDRRLLMQAVQRWAKYDYGGAELKVTACDLKIHRTVYCRSA